MGTLRLHGACNCQMHDRWYEAEKEFMNPEFVNSAVKALEPDGCKTAC